MKEYLQTALNYSRALDKALSFKDKLMPKESLSDWVKKKKNQKYKKKNR